MSHGTTFSLTSPSLLKEHSHSFPKRFSVPCAPSHEPQWGRLTWTDISTVTGVNSCLTTFLCCKNIPNFHFCTEPQGVSLTDRVYALQLAHINLWTTVGNPQGGCSEPALYNVYCMLYTRLQSCPAVVLPVCVTVEAAESSEWNSHVNFAGCLLHIWTIIAHIRVGMLKNNA